MNPDDVHSPAASRTVPIKEDLPVAAWTATLERELAPMHEAFCDLPHPLEWCKQIDDQAQILAFSAVHAPFTPTFQARPRAPPGRLQQRPPPACRARPRRSQQPARAPARPGR